MVEIEIVRPDRPKSRHLFLKILATAVVCIGGVEGIAVCAWLMNMASDVAVALAGLSVLVLVALVKVAVKWIWKRELRECTDWLESQSS